MTIIGTAALQLVQALGMLYLPTLNADIVDHGVVTGDIGHVLGRGGLMLAATLAQVACAAGATYLGARVAMGLGGDLRAALFAKAETFSVREVHHFGAASLLTRSTNDVQQVQLLVFTTLAMLLPAPFMAAGGIALAAQQDVPLSVVVVVAIPVAVAVIGLLIRRIVPLSRIMQGYLDAVNRVMREQIIGIRVIRAFVRDVHEQRRFAAASTDLMEVGIRMGRLQAYFGATSMLIANLAAVAVVAVGGPRIVDGGLRVGSLIAFLNYLSLILGAVMMGMSVFMMVPRAKVSAGRIDEVLGTGPSLAEPTVPVSPAALRGNLDLAEVTFGYPGAEEPVVRGVDLIARPGQTTAIIGLTGSGKTTLINLAARLLDVDSGAVTVDGVDVRRMDRRTLTATVGLVSQRAYLFSGTIADNLRYGDPGASDDELWHALDVAQAAEFVRAMPQGLGTRVGQGGSTVSGGQRQRLAIARVLLARPRIYLFDDAFAALDNATDAALRAALDREVGDASRVVVAQRVSTIRNAERIVVLDAGRIEAVGTHEELLTSSGTYAQIVRSQLAAREAIA
ncbi:ATP-binding cassette subfamily B protein [Saccharomonospora amisosensis]|uniref:ATP-binding cassette subfamily B protein n=1 Tax=Saccharomonospora amisosensis TaxID=1128677 RepID=A0A7X5UNW5_9PSEU|nr:ABC transporter ATP-binding protein [Saccharomonospora amisosensis]NIJ11477.1 ATP-binding cassette subfamily B protein [Saccharomonospora amisosensis]